MDHYVSITAVTLLVGMGTFFFRRLIMELDMVHKCLETRMEKTDLYRAEILTRIATMEAQLSVFKIALEKLSK